VDLEHLADRLLGKKDAEETLAARIAEEKGWDEPRGRRWAKAVLLEVENKALARGPLFQPSDSGVSMGEMGVGSRGRGDFYAHRKIAEVIGSTGAEVDSGDMDDSGVVRLAGGFLSVTVDGMHSRLSDFPLLAGFHCTRASLRDIYVMGARPLALLCDLHLADDGDVGRIFDFVAGVSAAGDAVGVPLVTGSTLRIGGDMVIGKRLTGCVGAVGYGEHLTPRRALEPGDVLLMTSGAGGGTITSTAIYHGRPDVVDATINVDFLRACEALLDSPLLKHVHSMTDVTNGGLRGDCHEMAVTAGLKVVVDEDAALELVHPGVRELLDELRVDALGVSIDALLLACPEARVQEIAGLLRGTGVRCEPVGRVEEGSGTFLQRNGELVDFTPRFRESAYTPLKKVVGDAEPPDWDELKCAVDHQAKNARARKEMLLRRLERNGKM